MGIKIVLVNLGYRKLMYPDATPPMGIMYLASFLRERKKDVEVKIINQRLENYTPEELVKVIYDIKPNIVGISSSTLFAYIIPIISDTLKQLLPDTWIVLGGPHASAIKKQAFIDCENLDIVVPGEGEIAFHQVVESYPQKKDLCKIPGIIWKDANGEIIENAGGIPIISDLDHLPFPAYDLIDLPRYWKIRSMTLVPRRSYASLVSSRGCPYHCIWCHSIFGKKIRFTSAERIVEEIKWLNKKYDIVDFEFLDDNFNFRQQRVFEFAELVKKNDLKLKLSFPNAIRADLVTEEVVESLYEAGTFTCSLALETGSPRLQKFTCKNLDIPKFIKTTEMMDKKGIYIHGFCMLGFPTETEEELQQTIDVAANSKLHTATFFTVIPFPGTPMYEWVKQNKPEKFKEVDYRDVCFVSAKVNLTDIPDDIFFGYQRKANIQFFFNLNRIFRVLKTYPKPLSLVIYVPTYIARLTKGIVSPS